MDTTFRDGCFYFPLRAASLPPPQIPSLWLCFSCSHPYPLLPSSPTYQRRQPSLDLAEEAGTGCLDSWENQFLYRVDGADPAEAELWPLGCRDQGRPQQAKWGFSSAYYPSSQNGQSPRDSHRTWSIFQPISGLGPGMSRARTQRSSQSRHKQVSLLLRGNLLPPSCSGLTP